VDSRGGSFATKQKKEYGRKGKGKCFDQFGEGLREQQLSQLKLEKDWELGLRHKAWTGMVCTCPDWTAFSGIF